MIVKFDIYVESKESQIENNKKRDLEKEKEKENEDGLPEPVVFREVLTKEEVLKKILEDWMTEKKVFGVRIVSVDNGMRRQFTFQAYKHDTDELYERLIYNGFGTPGSKTIIFTNDNNFHGGDLMEPDTKEDFDMDEKQEPEEKGLVDCLKSIQSQLTVHEVLANVRNKGQLSLDSIFQLVTAAMIAMSGLAMDDPVIVVASMFIAPLMDVINMVTFAIRINSRSDIKMGAKIFLLYIGIMLLLALILSQPMNEWAASMNIYMYGEKPTAYPTAQMTNRGHYMSMTGVVILALFSSLSSYSSLLNGYNFNVHIGNAISLSLVPPVMNCGMLLVFSMDIAVYFHGAHMNSTNPCLRAYSVCDALDHEVNKQFFESELAACKRTSWKISAMLNATTLASDKPKLCRYPRNSVIEALISLSITITTALIVILMGLGLMWLKKFTPGRLDKNHVAEFYKTDLDTYVNESQKKVRHSSNTQFLQQIRADLRARHLSRSDCEMALALAQQTAHFQTIAASCGPPTFTYTRTETALPTARPSAHPRISAHPSRSFNRQISRNQRTIYDNYAPQIFSQNSIPDQDADSDDEYSPLRSSGISVGRFHISRPDPHSPTV